MRIAFFCSILYYKHFRELFMNAPQKIYKFKVEYWSSIDWAWIEYHALAIDENQVKALVDSQCSLDYRQKEKLTMVDGEFINQSSDSLVITELEELTLPYVIHHN